MIDLGRNAVVTDIRVNVVGEIDRGRASGQLPDCAPWGEDINHIGEEVDFDAIEKL